MAGRAGVAHEWVKVAERVLHAPSLTPAQVIEVRAAERAGNAVCPLCEQPMRLAIEDGGPVAYHRDERGVAAHEPETRTLRAVKRLIVGRLKALMPSATVGADVPMPGRVLLADVALVTSQGGRLVVETQASDLTTTEVRARIDGWAEHATQCLWVIDQARLVLPKKGADVKTVMLGKLETALLANNQPLIYVDSRDKTCTRLTPPPDAVRLARLGEAKLGRVPCLVRRYRLDQLRLRDGRWWVDTTFDPPAPAAPDLPAGLAAKLRKREAAAGAAA